MQHQVTAKQKNAAHCFVCGNENPYGLNMRYYELENGDVAGIFTAKEEHQSYPGRLHGGVIAAILDETAGRALSITEGPDVFGVTVELSLRYKKPVPLETELKAIGRITRNTRILFEGEAEILLPDGEVAATAYGKYWKMDVNKIVAEADAEDFVDVGEWRYIEGEDDPATIEY
ncbi:PaaI family thioesterase [Eubacteriales bacterium OttesenSCG-928-M02]|nr:PaaI family thioesterase [Eubacteriales bacterium OttesenSCG-928-M02]